jgi:hypothetical protein
MDTFTSHYNLEKPDGDSIVSVDIINSNSDKIDTAIFNATSSILTGTLSSNKWSGNTQTIQVVGLETTGYVYLTFPSSNNFEAYAKAGIYPNNVTITNSITFNCAKTPTTNIVVNIIKIKVGA